ncbi:VOC family protein [Halobacillus litoralis]|uniref:VOC family protein n=1 Tax=Halobacillus litoralis TaxID=45668 RepID=UPI001CFD8A20|nr:VOC family protein [Halobacillus litoralis]
MIDRIDTICVTVQDLPASKKWYQTRLGFEAVFEGEGYCVLRVGSGGTPLTIEEGERMDRINQTTYPIFYSHSIEETYQSLKEKNVQVGKLMKDSDNHYFDFYDPDGNRLQVCFFE